MRAFYITEEDGNVLAEMVRAYRAGEVGGRLAGRKATPGPAVSRFGPLWQVTAVDTGAETCDVQRVESDGTLDDTQELAGIGYVTEPAVGDKVMVSRYGDGPQVAFAGGVGLPRYVRATEDMTDANTAYVCRYVEGNGGLGDEVNVRPPYGQDIENGEEGALMTDGDGNLRFLPCHGRTDQNNKSVMEVRDSDPATSEAGRHWLVT